MYGNVSLYKGKRKIKWHPFLKTLFINIETNSEKVILEIFIFLF